MPTILFWLLYHFEHCLRTNMMWYDMCLCVCVCGFIIISKAIYSSNTRYFTVWSLINGNWIFDAFPCDMINNIDGNLQITDSFHNYISLRFDYNFDSAHSVIHIVYTSMNGIAIHQKWNINWYSFFLNSHNWIKNCLQLKYGKLVQNISFAWFCF